MRFTLLPLLLLGASPPALAAEPGGLMERVMERRAAQREARQEQRSERIERRSDRADQAPRTERRERDRPAAVSSEAPTAVSQPRERASGWTAPARTESSSTQSQDHAEGIRWRERAAERVRRNREERVAPSPADAVAGASIPPASGANPRARSDDGRTFDRLRDRVAAEGWRQEWRRDRRYDWRRYRDRDRSRFRIGFYIDPFGWNYRPWQLGGYLPSRFYRSSYWIDDPWYYRLPPAYGPYRWVRYWNDVLLVDMRSGRIVDRIPNFFW